jgi:hypothetical protein
MRSKEAYDLPMRWWAPAVGIALAMLVAVSATGQVNGTAPCVTCFNFGNHHGFNGEPPSVTSPGFGTKPGFNGARPGVTSLGPNGWTPRNPAIHQPGTHHPTNHRPPDHRHSQVYLYPYFVPYYPAMNGYDDAPAESADAEDPEEYQGGPTIFDRRGSGTYSDDFVAERPKARVPRPPYPPQEAGSVRVPDPPQEASNASAPDPPAAPIAREPDTILVFKDGHKIQVGNYAIVGSNLFDLTPGHRQKVALADVDVPATQKANDDQGVDFKLPSAPGEN